MLKHVFPFLRWFEDFNMSILRTDFIAGLNVALVLVPQSMAYAQLAGLPVIYGLYASFLPPMMAALFGSSNQLATGPVAVVSLMTAAALQPIAIQGSEGYIAYAILLALIVGIVQLALGILRLGILVSFLSHPVVIGFTNAAALIIASSQLAKLFGVSVDNAAHHYRTIYRIFREAFWYTHWPTLFMGLFSIVLMLGIRRLFPKVPNVLAAVVLTTLIAWFIGYERNVYIDLSQIESPQIQQLVREFNHSIETIEVNSKKRTELAQRTQEVERESGRNSVNAHNIRHEALLVNVEITDWEDISRVHRYELRRTLFVSVEDREGKRTFYLSEQEPTGRVTDGRIWRLKVGNKLLNESKLCMAGGGEVVGTIPQGLPRLKTPQFDLNVMIHLIPVAFIISLLGFMEAISIAKAMAAKTGQRLDPNQELIGQGTSNIIGSFGQSYPVSGSFSRSAVNIQAGAQTGLSSVFTSAIVVVALLFFTPYLYHLPQAVLASIIMMAVIRLVDIPGMARAWRTQKYDGAISVITFVATLFFAPHLDYGIGIGVFLSLSVFLLLHMRPKVYFLAKHPDGSFRDTAFWELKECRYICVVRFSGSLFFADADYLENKILDKIASSHDLRHILIVGNAINELDASGEDMLSSLIDKIHSAGLEVSFSGLNDEIIQVMRRTHLYDKIGEPHLFRNVNFALQSIHADAHRESQEKECPLLKVCSEETPVKTGKGAFFLRQLKKT